MTIAPKHLFVHCSAEGIFPPAGQRHHAGRHPRLAGRVVWFHAGGHGTLRPSIIKNRTGSGQCRSPSLVAMARPNSGFRFRCTWSRSAERTNRGGPSDCEAAAKARRHPGRVRLHAARPGFAHRRPARSNAGYQYTIQSDNLDDLVNLGANLAGEHEKASGFHRGEHLDQQNQALQASLVYDRPTAARAGHLAACRWTPRFTMPLGRRKFPPCTGHEPVSRGHGSRAAILAGAAGLERHLRCTRPTARPWCRAECRGPL